MAYDINMASQLSGRGSFWILQSLGLGEMRKLTWILICLLGVNLSVVLMLSAAVLLLPVKANMRMWVAIEDMKRRTCPSADCGVIGFFFFFFRESVFVYETSNGWSRVSPYYTAGCYEGQSAFVDAGRSDCTVANGIEQGQFAEWVRSEFLTDERPDTPKEYQG